MNVKKFGLSQASNGHYLLAVGGFEDIEVADIPNDFKMASGCEAWIMQPAANQRIEGDEPSPPCDALRPCPVAAVNGGGELGGCSREEEEVDSSRMSSMRRSRSPRTGVSVAERRVRAGGDEGGSRLCRRNSEEEYTEDASHPTVEDSTDFGSIRAECQGGAGQSRTGHDQRADQRGEDHDREEESQGTSIQDEEGNAGRPDRRGSRLPESEPCVVGRGGYEHGVLAGFEDASVPMEEALVAAASEGCSGTHNERCSLEAQPSLAVPAAGKGGGRGVWSLRGHEAEDEQSRHLAPDVEGQRMQKEVQRLQRGDVQRLKNGASAGLARVNAVLGVTAQENRFVLLEIYAGAATLTKVARQNKDTWTPLDPVDILYGYDLTKLEDRKRVWQVIEKEEPDLITLAMPCGPWCQWMNLCDPDTVEEKRTESMPLWRFARQVWDHQVQRHRLVLTENPLGSEGLKMTFMEQRKSCYRAKVAQCCFGLNDVENGKPHRKLTAFDASCPVMAAALEEGAVCMHRPEEHQVLEGNGHRSCAGTSSRLLRSHCREWERSPCGVRGWGSMGGGSRGEWAGAWGRDEEEDGRAWCGGWQVWLCDLWRSWTTSTSPNPSCSGSHSLYLGTPSQWQAGANADAFRSWAASAGCSQKPKMRGMLHGTSATRCTAGGYIQTIILQCQSFRVKFAVVHFLDGLTDYHVADCTVNADSSFAASVLRDQWYGVFGPPDLLLTDAGTEYSGAVDVLNEIFGVMHDIIPEGAKWRLGQAERHGSILKLMMMKMTREKNIVGKEEMRMAASAACAAKNRLCNHGGVSPLQAVTGRNAVLPASLMTQICSGKMRFVVNNDVDKEESLRREERIRMAAVESFHWIDAHTTLRRALAAKSRPPKLEMLKEGAVVYIYDPPAIEGCRTMWVGRVRAQWCAWSETAMYPTEFGWGWKEKWNRCPWRRSDSPLWRRQWAATSSRRHWRTSRRNWLQGAWR